MLDRSVPGAKRALMSVAVIALLVLSTGSAAADTGPAPAADLKFSQNGSSADAGAGGCTSNGDGSSTCWNTSLSVFVGKMSDSLTGVSHLNQICVFSDRYTADDETGDLIGEPVFESGCVVDLPSGTLRVASDLSSATLLATTISVTELICPDKYTCEEGPSRDVSVAGAWTGSGAINASRYRFSGSDDVCRYDESGKGRSREATFAGTVDGLTISEDAWASLAEGKSTYRSRCDEG